MNDMEIGYMDKYCSKQLLEFSFVSIHVHVVKNDLFKNLKLNNRHHQ